MIEPTDVDWTGYRRLEPAQAKSLPVEAFVAECPNCLTIIRYFGQSSQLKAWNTVTKDYGWPCCEGRAHLNPEQKGGARTGVLIEYMNKLKEETHDQDAEREVLGDRGR